MELKFKRLSHEGLPPLYATDGAACFDFRVPNGDAYVFAPGGRMMVRSAIAVEVPEGHVMLMYSRSGHGAKNGLRLSNCVGVIDSDYRGEIMASFRNDGDSGFTLSSGDKFAQGMLVPIPRVNIREVEELSETARGEGGFGSTDRDKFSPFMPAPENWNPAPVSAFPFPPSKRPALTSTHSVATLEVSASAYEEIRGRLIEADYEHLVSKSAFDVEECIDMSGVALVRGK